MPSSTATPKRNGTGGRIVRSLFFLISLATVCAASVGATWMVMTRMQEQAHAQTAVATDDAMPTPTPVMTIAAAPEPVPTLPPPPIFYELAPFTVTVENGIAERILHVGITLRLADELSRQRLENYLPEVRSRVLLELAKLAPDDLKGSQGRVTLANAIVDTLNRPFAPQPVGQYVTDVLFTTFVVQ